MFSPIVSCSTKAVTIDASSNWNTHVCQIEWGASRMNLQTMVPTVVRLIFGSLFANGSKYNKKAIKHIGIKNK